MSRGSIGAVAGARRSGGATGPPPGTSRLPAQSSRTGQTQPEADEHRHEQAEHGDLVGAVAERSRNRKMIAP